MIHLMELELRKIKIRPYIYAGFAAILCMVGLLYTFAMIAHVGGDSDAAEFSTYYNIWVLVNALQTAAYSILMAVMFSTFLLKDYTGKMPFWYSLTPQSAKNSYNAKSLWYHCLLQRL